MGKSGWPPHIHTRSEVLHLTPEGYCRPQVFMESKKSWFVLV